MVRRPPLAPAFVMRRDDAGELVPDGVVTLHCVLCAKPGERRPSLRDAVLCKVCFRNQVVGHVGTSIILDAVKRILK